jgi:hypothetical protein
VPKCGKTARKVVPQINGRERACCWSTGNTKAKKVALIRDKQLSAQFVTVTMEMYLKCYMIQVPVMRHAMQQVQDLFIFGLINDICSTDYTMSNEHDIE